MDWQGRCSQLVSLIDPGRSFGPGVFEALDDAAWSTLVGELRDLAMTEGKLAAAAQAAAQAAAVRAAAVAKLTAEERAALGV
jgi:hypothetical protein